LGQRHSFFSNKNEKEDNMDKDHVKERKLSANNSKHNGFPKSDFNAFYLANLKRKSLLAFPLTVTYDKSQKVVFSEVRDT